MYIFLDTNLKINDLPNPSKGGAKDEISIVSYNLVLIPPQTSANSRTGSEGALS